MRTFAQKPKTTQPTTSARASTISRAHVGQSHNPNSILNLQHAIGNQALLQLLQSNAEERNTLLTGTTSPHFGHDFSRIPVTPPKAGAIHTKLEINQPEDEYKQEADRAAEQVMRIPEPGHQRACACGGECPKCQKKPAGQEPERRPTMLKTSVWPPAPQGLLQRKCACGAASGRDHSCPECRANKLGAQHLATDGGAQGLVPPIVREVLSSPGEPLDAATRAFMEPRFRHDFRRVRVHADTQAANSAQAVNAFAYAVGSDIVFGAGRYAPQTTEGQRLLAHELAHVVQQSNIPTRTAGMVLGRSEDGLERAADRAAEVVSAGSGRLDVAAMPQASRATLSRWKITANVATVDSEQDRLGDLAVKLKAGADNWQCIRPIRMRTAEVTPIPADFETRYEGYLQIGDQFDLSNLQSGFMGPSLRLSLFSPAENNHTIVATLYPGSQVSKDPDQDIAKASNEGGTPLADLIIAGHQVGGVMFGASGRFDLSSVSPDVPARTFTRAKDAKFPRRCWFTPFGNARSVGCSSTSFGQRFAAVYLRSGAGIDTTLRLIHPACTQAFRNAQGECSSIDAIQFSPAAGEAESADHGPFKLSSPQDFHASPFWDRIQGKL